jgi:hypothetical protein
MITLTHSEAFAYDLLAIAAIKAVRNHSDKTVTELSRLELEISRQVGWDRHEEVMTSPEYAHLYKVNDEMYMRIDELKARGEQPGDASYIDDRVYQRYLAKQALQAAHFPGSELTEQKFGYGKDVK